VHAQLRRPAVRHLRRNELIPSDHSEPHGSRRVAGFIGEDRCWLYSGPGEIADEAELDARAIHRTGARVEDLYNERLVEEASGLSALAVAGDDEEGCGVSGAWKSEIPSGTPENKNKGDKSDTHPETSPDRLRQAPIYVLNIGRVTHHAMWPRSPFTDGVCRTDSRCSGELGNLQRAGEGAGST
jgi:hypothetical protein